MPLLQVDILLQKNWLKCVFWIFQTCLEHQKTICHSQVEEINSLVAEIVNVTGKEKFLLQQCKDFLSTLAAMQVDEIVSSAIIG